VQREKGTTGRPVLVCPGTSRGTSRPVETLIGTLISSISLQQEISIMVKQKCFALKKFYIIGTLIPSISMQ
jgi:hypothetical protein